MRNDPVFAFQPFEGGPSQRVLYHVWVRLVVEEDVCREALLSKNYDEFDWLPPIALRLRGQDPRWLRQLVDAAEGLADRLATATSNDWPIAFNMAEQVWLGYALRMAEEMVVDGYSEEVEGDQGPTLTGDLDFEFASEILLEDFDHEFLYMPQLDGIESADGLMAEGLGLTQHLHPDQWFTPFYPSSS
jgi:hypothetical protein